MWKTSFIQNPSSAKHLRLYKLRLECAHEHTNWHADSNKASYLTNSAFISVTLWPIDVKYYCAECYLLERIKKHHSGRTLGVVIWNAIAHHEQSHLLRIVGSLNSSRHIIEVLEPHVVTFVQGIPRAIFQQNIAHSHVTKNI